MDQSDPLRGALQLYKGLWAIHIQSNPASHKLDFTYELLVLSCPLHTFPTQQVLWAALTMAHFSFLQMGKFIVDQEIFDPTWHLCVQDVTPSLTAQAELQYVTIHLKVGKTDPFGQGINVIIGCSHTQVCGACSAWDLIQSHWGQTSPSNSAILSAVLTATLNKHHCGSHQRPSSQIRIQPLHCIVDIACTSGEQPWPPWPASGLGD